MAEETKVEWVGPATMRVRVLRVRNYRDTSNGYIREDSNEIYAQTVDAQDFDLGRVIRAVNGIEAKDSD